MNGFLDFQLAGAITQSALLGGLAGGIGLALDIELGFIDRLVASPISRGTIVLGRLVGTAAVGLVSGIWFVVIGLVFGAKIESGLPGVALVLVVSVLSATAFGSVAAAIAIRTGRLAVLQGIFPLLFVVLFLSSAFFPRGLLLEPASSVADVNPLSFVAEGMRAPIIGDIELGQTLEALAGVGAVALTGVALTTLAIRSRLRTG